MSETFTLPNSERFAVIRADDVYGAWVELLRLLILEGEERSPRGLPTREVLGVTFRVDFGLENIIFHPDRNLNYKFMIAEALWILEGCDTLEVIAQYNQKIRQFSDDGLTLSGAYGPRLMPQIPWVFEKLSESDTRQAVATIWTPMPKPSKDQCCTVALQFLRRDNVVNLIVTMRSSDVWLGIPYDFFTFSTILNMIAAPLKCDVGWVQFNLGSSHLYLTDLPQASLILKRPQLGETFSSPPVTSNVPLDLFYILHSPGIWTPTIGQRMPEPWNIYAEVLATSTRRADAHKLLRTARS